MLERMKEAAAPITEFRLRLMERELKASDRSLFIAPERQRHAGHTSPRNVQLHPALHRP
jgi:hypothetical protein